MSQDYRLSDIYKQVYTKTSKPSSFTTLTELYKDVTLYGLNEAIVGSTSKDHSLIRYFTNINELLDNQTEFPVMISKEEVMFTPDADQQIIYDSERPKAALNAVLTGTVDGSPKHIKVRHIVKTAEIKGKPFGNRGQIVEGVLGAAIFARFIKRPNEPIVAQDIYNVVSELAESDSNTNTKTFIKKIEERDGTTDTFKLEVKLKSLAMQSFLDVNTLKIVLSEDEIAPIVDYANRASRKFAKLFQTNKKPDFVEVKSDGVSHETTSKVDVDVKANGELLYSFALSVKAANTKIIGQRGSGGERITRTEQFQILQSVWNEFGVSIENVESTFLASETLESAYKVGYLEAAKRLASQLSLDYSSAVKSILQGINTFGALNDPKLRIVQFGKGEYYVLNLSRVFNILKDNKISLTAEYDYTKVRPTIKIYDKNSGMDFLTIRTFRQSNGYIRNLIEKEPLLVNVTKVHPFDEEKEENEENIKEPTIQVDTFKPIV